MLNRLTKSTEHAGAGCDQVSTGGLAQRSAAFVGLHSFLKASRVIQGVAKVEELICSVQRAAGVSTIQHTAHCGVIHGKEVMGGFRE